MPEVPCPYCQRETVRCPQCSTPTTAFKGHEALGKPAIVHSIQCPSCIECTQAPCEGPEVPDFKHPEPYTYTLTRTRWTCTNPEHSHKTRDAAMRCRLRTHRIKRNLSKKRTEKERFLLRLHCARKLLAGQPARAVAEAHQIAPSTAFKFAREALNQARRQAKDPGPLSPFAPLGQIRQFRAHWEAMLDSWEYRHNKQGNSKHNFTFETVDAPETIK